MTHTEHVFGRCCSRPGRRRPLPSEPARFPLRTAARQPRTLAHALEAIVRLASRAGAAQLASRQAGAAATAAGGKQEPSLHRLIQPSVYRLEMHSRHETCTSLAGRRACCAGALLLRHLPQALQRLGCRRPAGGVSHQAVLYQLHNARWAVDARLRQRPCAPPVHQPLRGELNQQHAKAACTFTVQGSVGAGVHEAGRPGPGPCGWGEAPSPLTPPTCTCRQPRHSAGP